MFLYPACSYNRHILYRRYENRLQKRVLIASMFLYQEIVFSIENNYPVPIFFCENLHIWMSAFEWNTKNIFYFKILEVVRHFMTNI